MNDVTQPEKMPLTSPDIAEEKRDQLRQCLAATFPEIMAEDNIDLDQLRRVLGEWVEPDRERFGLNWPGKAACMKVIQAPSVGTLRPCKEESVDWDTTENVFIEGDNLEVLKLLQKAYFGKIKMIYIDPPYNTGKEFIYPDKYAETLETYLEYTGQKDSEGRKFATNTDSSGRFHSRWLNMMYPRLYLAKNLLKEDGIIFITIDDGELANLKLLCDHVFGQERFFACIAWQAKDTAGNDAKGIANVHNYVLAYTKSPEFEPNLFARTEKQIAYYKNPDNDPRGPWLAVPLTRGEYRERDHYALRNPAGEEVWPPAGNSWRRPPAEIEKLQADGRIWWGTKGDSQFPSIKAFLSEVKEGTTPISWWDYKFAGSTRRARSELKELFEGERGFDTPKPTLLVSRMLELATCADEPDIVLDFFAGSSTTADAVLRKNQEDNGQRRFIMVQLPEPFEGKTIAELSRERVRKAIARIQTQAGSLDTKLGFRSFQLAQSNFKIWQGEAAGLDDKGSQLDLYADHILDGSQPNDILFELLLKDGFPLTVPLKELELGGKNVISVAGGVLLICLDKKLTQDVMDALADMEPSRVICLDAGFQGNDQLKANAVQAFKSRARNRETAIEFRTV